jgi:hypothetical protein
MVSSIVRYFAIRSNVWRIVTSRNALTTTEITIRVIGHKWLISPGAIQDFIRRKEQEALRAA